MKKYRWFGLLITLLLIATHAGLAQAAPRWSYLGQKEWRLPDGRSFTADYAQQRVGDDALTLLFDRDTRHWIMLFTYNSEYAFYHSTSRGPEIFVRTLENSGRGRLDTDYLISRRPQTFTNGSHQPQFVVIELEPEDLRYLKMGLDLGMSYYVEDKCVTAVEGSPCIQTSKHLTYLFAGNNIADVITEIETRNGLAISKPILQDQRQDDRRHRLENEDTAKYIRWFEGDWMQVSQAGPLYGGCDALHEIDSDQFPHLTQKNGPLGGEHHGTLAISASGNTAHDHVYISSAYPHIRQLAQDDSLSTGAAVPSQTRKIPVYVEQGKGPYIRLRLGAEIPGIPHKMIIETNGKLIRLVAWDAAGTAAEPMLFSRCE